MRGKRIVEAHAVLQEARTPFLSKRLTDFLQALFEEQPVLTQSLIFYKGSEQALHQDTAFVAYREPMKLAAAWIALEDVVAGSGELVYVPGSHRLPDFIFSGDRKNLHLAAQKQKDAYFAWLHKQSAEMGLQIEHFLPKKGDALVWHADLMHGGAPVTDSSLTRRSLVGHFCPASTKPTYARADIRERDGPLLYSSALVDVANSTFLY